MLSGPLRSMVND